MILNDLQAELARGMQQKQLQNQFYHLKLHLLQVCR